MSMNTENLYHRQRDIFNPSEVEQKAVHIIGCGTIGSWSAMALHKLGIRNVTLWDFDEVEAVNVPSQNFTMRDIGENKAEIIGRAYGYQHEAQRYVYRGVNLHGSIYILAVDSLESRREILAQLPAHAYVIDGRMSGEGYEVHAGRADSIKVPAEASEDVCTAKGIIYVSLGIAAEIAHVVKQNMLGQPVDYKILYRDYRGGNTLKIK